MSDKKANLRWNKKTTDQEFSRLIAHGNVLLENISNSYENEAKSKIESWNIESFSLLKNCLSTDDMYNSYKQRAESLMNRWLMGEEISATDLISYQIGSLQAYQNSLRSYDGLLKVYSIQCGQWFLKNIVEPLCKLKALFKP